MGGRSPHMLTFFETTFLVASLWSVANGADAPPTLTSQTQQLNILGQESASQIVNTSAHISDLATEEYQRQIGNLRRAADIAAAPIVAGISNEARALLNAAQALGMPRLEDALTGGLMVTPLLTPEDDRKIIVDVYEPQEDQNAPGEQPDQDQSDGEKSDTKGNGEMDYNQQKDGEMTTAGYMNPAAAKEGDGDKKAERPSPGKAFPAAPGPSPPDDTDWELPSFAGKPLSRSPIDIKVYKQQLKRKGELDTAEKQAHDEGNAPGTKEIPFPIYYLDQLRHMNDKEASKIFHRGTAEIPSQISPKHFAYCDKAITLANSVEKPNAWPGVSFPIIDDLLDPISRAVWHGKFFSTNKDTNETQLWNLLFSPFDLGVIANVSLKEGGYSGDGRNSFIVDYSTSENVLGRVGQDEFRRVGPTIFLGRGFLWLDIQELLPKYASGFERAILDAIEPLTSATEKAILNAQQVVRRIRNISPLTRDDASPLKAIPFSFFFAIECQDYHIPKLHYSPVASMQAMNLNKILGYNAPYYELPRIPGEYLDTSWDPTKSKFSAPAFTGYPEDEAPAPAPSLAVFDLNDPSFDLKFDSQKSSKKGAPYILFPVAVPSNASHGIKESEGFIQLPAREFEKAFGADWSSNVAHEAQASEGKKN